MQQLTDNATTTSDLKKHGFHYKYGNWISCMKNEAEFKNLFIEILKKRNFLLMINDKNTDNIKQINLEYKELMIKFIKQLYKARVVKKRSQFMNGLLGYTPIKQFFSTF